MKIKFDTATMTEAEARGLSAMLAAMWPGAEQHVHDERVISYIAKQPIDPDKIVSRDFAWTSMPAPDGYPVDSAPFTPPNPESLPPLPTLDRDVAGIPWDERIHASTKTTNKDGTWTRRRNTPDDVFDKVMAELKAANTAMTLEAAAGLTAEPEPTTPTAAEAFTPPASVVIPPAVPAPPVPVVPPAPVATDGPAPLPVATDGPAPLPVATDGPAPLPVDVMKYLTAHQVPKDRSDAALAEAGIKDFPSIFTSTDDQRRKLMAALERGA